MIQEHDRVVLTASVPEGGLEPGDVGTVMHVYVDGKAYEVEFATLDGHTRAVVTLEAGQIRPVSRRDMTHARPVQPTYSGSCGLKYVDFPLRSLCMDPASESLASSEKSDGLDRCRQGIVRV